MILQYVLVENYTKHGNLYGEYTALCKKNILWPLKIIINNHICDVLLMYPDCYHTMRQNFIIDVLASEVNAYKNKLLPANVENYLSHII